MGVTPLCAGCLGAMACWVCLWTGAFDTVARRGTCSSCDGTARCRYCPPAVIVLDPVDVVPDQRSVPLQERTDRHSTVR